MTQRFDDITDRNSPVVARRKAVRRLLAWVTLPVIAAGGRCASRQQSASIGKQQQPVHGPLKIRTVPLAVPIHGLKSTLIERRGLAQATRVALPPRLPKYPLGVIQHVLHLWGLEVPFGKLFLAAITNNSTFRRLCVTRFHHLLSVSSFGVQVRCTADQGMGSEWGVTHPGAYIHLMAELGIPATYRLSLGHGTEATLADAIRDTAKRTHLAVELEWIVAGLCRYLADRSWKNRFGQLFSFDKLALELVARNFGEGPCFGTHVPYALATLLAVHAQAPILSPATADAVRRRLCDYAARVTLCQKSDGSIDKTWAIVTPRTKRYLAVTLGNRELESVSITGHHLEWMTISLPETRPDDSVLEGCASYLVRSIPRFRSAVKSDWHVYLPISHAVKALWQTIGMRYACLDMANCSVRTPT